MKWKIAAILAFASVPSTLALLCTVNFLGVLMERKYRPVAGHVALSGWSAAVDLDLRYARPARLPDLGQLERTFCFGDRVVSPPLESDLASILQLYGTSELPVAFPEGSVAVAIQGPADWLPIWKRSMLAIREKDAWLIVPGVTSITINTTVATIFSALYSLFWMLCLMIITIRRGSTRRHASRPQASPPASVEI